MAVTDSEALADARKELERAIQNFVTIKCDEQLDKAGAYVMHWVTMAEFVSPDDINEGKSHSFKIVKDGQLASATIGLCTMSTQIPTGG